MSQKFLRTFTVLSQDIQSLASIALALLIYEKFSFSLEKVGSDDLWEVPSKQWNIALDRDINNL